jgi:hypothetical protein
MLSMSYQLPSEQQALPSSFVFACSISSAPSAPGEPGGEPCVCMALTMRPAFRPEEEESSSSGFAGEALRELIECLRYGAGFSFPSVCGHTHTHTHTHTWIHVNTHIGINIYACIRSTCKGWLSEKGLGELSVRQWVALLQCKHRRRVQLHRTRQ